MFRNDLPYFPCPSDREQFRPITRKPIREMRPFFPERRGLQRPIEKLRKISYQAHDSCSRAVGVFIGFVSLIKKIIGLTSNDKF